MRGNVWVGWCPSEKQAPGQPCRQTRVLTATWDRSCAGIWHFPWEFPQRNIHVALLSLLGPHRVVPDPTGATSSLSLCKGFTVCGGLA